MKKTVTIELPVEEAESILRSHAGIAARFGAYLDYITRRTYQMPGPEYTAFDDRRKIWNEKYLGSLRVVRAFGIEPERTSEEETLTVHIPMKNEKRKLRVIAGMQFNEVSGGEPDYKHPIPEHRVRVHLEACIAAAERTVRKWKETL